MILLPFLLVSGAFLVVGVVLVAARRLLPDDPQRPHQETASAIFSMVGTLYAVILAFVVIVVWENDRKARDDTQVEANAVSRIYFTARALPEPQRQELMELAQAYAETVVEQEWPLMARGETSAAARGQVAQMRVTTHQLRPQSADEEILMTGTLAAIDALVDSRRERTSALSAPVSPMLWLGLVVGSVLTVGFGALLGRPRFPLHLLMVGSMAGLIVFILWLVYDLSLPYSGVSAVDPGAFVQIRQRFQEFPPDG